MSKSFWFYHLQEIHFPLLNPQISVMCSSPVATSAMTQLFTQYDLAKYARDEEKFTVWFQGPVETGCQGVSAPSMISLKKKRRKKNNTKKKKNSLNKLQKSLNRMPLERSITHCYHVISHKHTSTVGNQDSPPCGNYIQKELWPAPSQPNSFLHIDLFKREK